MKLKEASKGGGFSDDQEYDKNKKNIIIWKKFIELLIKKYFQEFESYHEVWVLKNSLFYD
jgi:hypothetical protein